MDYFKCLKIISLNNVLNPSGDFRLREIFRWYSKTFHTPLHLVSSLPLEDILSAYFEEMYSQLDAEDIEEQKQLLLETDEQRIQRMMNEESDKVNEQQFMEQAKKDELRRKNKIKNTLIKDKKDKDKILDNAQEEVKIIFTDDNLDLEKDSLISPIPKKSEW